VQHDTAAFDDVTVVDLASGSLAMVSW